MAAMISSSRSMISTISTHNASRQSASCSVSCAAPSSKAVAMPAFRGLKATGLEAKMGVCSLTSTRPLVASRQSVIVQAGNMEVDVGLFGHKAGMTQIFTDDGNSCTGVSVINIQEGNIITQVKTDETHGYNAVQVCYDKTIEKRANKPELGHLKASGAEPMKLVQEFRVSAECVAKYEVGQQLAVGDMFKEGDLVDVRGKTVGKGFQGGIKRHGFKRGLMTHGSKSKREHGSMGAGTDPGRVLPGTKGAGQMGNKMVKNPKMEVMRVDADNNFIMLKGSIPGKPGGILRITPAKIVGVNIPKYPHEIRLEKKQAELSTKEAVVTFRIK